MGSFLQNNVCLGTYKVKVQRYSERSEFIRCEVDLKKYLTSKNVFEKERTLFLRNVLKKKAHNAVKGFFPFQTIDSSLF